MVRASGKKRQDDLDFCFISLWISFNAIYADDLNEIGDRSAVTGFLKKLSDLDTDKLLYALVWDTFSDNIRILLNNQYSFQPFWDEYNKPKTTTVNSWEERFESEKKKVTKAMGTQNTAHLLTIVFRRLYTLRNQIIHGGATYNSSTNQSQKKKLADFCLLLFLQLLT
ncbi:HEPN domain-containing protein [Treponema phagedenis]|uniref:HEPN domain-containing protein n=1 Tax=Treponema phagedenis TaxID=162 RepID=UPI00197FF09A|nr:HEPN domain-containing protein [Treponema phagedenis]QSH96055.1 hypothetical protein C5O78_13720 [Treponema phagedenis]